MTQKQTGKDKVTISEKELKEIKRLLVRQNEFLEKQVKLLEGIESNVQEIDLNTM